MKSALWYDGKMTEEEKNGNNFVWGDYNNRCQRKQLNFEQLRLPIISEYKKFVVLSDEIDRKLRWMNWVHKNKYNRYYTFDLPKDKAIEELIWSIPLLVAHPYKSDPHCLSQKHFLESFVKIHYEGDTEKFNNEVIKVELKNLKEFYQDNFGEPLILNNVSDPKKKRFSINDLSERQRERLLQF